MILTRQENKTIEAITEQIKENIEEILDLGRENLLKIGKNQRRVDDSNNKGIQAKDNDKHDERMEKGADRPTRRNHIENCDN